MSNKNWPIHLEKSLKEFVELSPKKILSNRSLIHIFQLTVARSQLWHHRKKNRGARLTDLALLFFSFFFDDDKI